MLVYFRKQYLQSTEEFRITVWSYFIEGNRKVGLTFVRRDPSFRGHPTDSFGGGSYLDVNVSPLLLLTTT